MQKENGETERLGNNKREREREQESRPRNRNKE